MANALAATLSPEQGLSSYLSEIRRFPMLEKDEEFMLGKSWREHGDTNAAESLSPPTFASWPRSPWAIAAMACRSEK